MPSQSAPLTLFTNPRSRGRIVRWMLEEIGCPYETEILDYATTLKGPADLAINPMGKIPALRHGDAVVTETAAICAYLADAFPEAKLIPPADDRPARAAYYRWLFFAAGPVEAAVSNKVLGVNVPEDKRRFVGYGSYAETIRTLVTAVENKDFIAGGQFTAADVYVGSHIAYGLEFGTIEPHPAFERYVKAMKARPAAIRAARIDDALLAA